MNIERFNDLSRQLDASRQRLQTLGQQIESLNEATRSQVATLHSSIRTCTDDITRVQDEIQRVSRDVSHNASPQQQPGYGGWQSQPTQEQVVTQVTQAVMQQLRQQGGFGVQPNGNRPQT